MLQCLPFCRLTLGQHKSDSNSCIIIQLTDVFCVLFRYDGPAISYYNKWLILIQLSFGHCIKKCSWTTKFCFDFRVWLEATRVVFLSLQLGLGVISTYASYNKYHHNIIRLGKKLLQFGFLFHSLKKIFKLISKIFEIFC